MFQTIKFVTELESKEIQQTSFYFQMLAKSMQNIIIELL